jgi:hypothetical protein
VRPQAASLASKGPHLMSRAANNANGDACVIDRAIAQCDCAAKIAPNVAGVGLARRRATIYSQF